MFRHSRGHLQAEYLKHIRKYTDHVRKGDLASHMISSQIWSLHKIDFEIKIED